MYFYKNFITMKNKVILICAVTLCCYLSAIAQNPFKDLSENYSVTKVTFKGQSPTIVDFITCYLSETEDELHGALSEKWDKYLNKEELGQGVSFTVDQKNGYVRCDEDYDVAYPDDPSGIKSFVEYCYWNCDDGKHKLFAENVCLTQNGKPIFTEFSGMYIYVYDNASKTLYTIDQNLIGLGDELYDYSQNPTTFALPQKGKDIDVFFNIDGKVTQKKLTWNGKGFKLSK